MTKSILAERAATFDDFRRIREAGRNPFVPQALEHIYIKLTFKLQFESASTAEDARKFLRSIARAAMAAQGIGEQYEGILLEVQGSLLHVGLPLEKRGSRAFVADLHAAYMVIFNDRGLPVDDWRMTVDGGNTLIVSAPSVHGDESYVSLGKSANRPAKHLYAQLELPEDRRDLKRFHVGIRDPRTDRWRHHKLDDLPTHLEEAKAIAQDARRIEPALDFFEVFSEGRVVTARSAPISPSGTPGSPSAEKPHAYFGWVMRADLDGFTARVEECFDNDQKLQELAVQFFAVMDAAQEFAEGHAESLVQLPWAGDNFTAAAVFGSRHEYDEAIPKRLVELSLDFEKEMNEAADDGGFGGWAHGIAGGEVHGSSRGNIYLAGVEVGGRRFLVGAGEGFGRSAQAFGDVNPDAGELVVYESDYQRLDEDYKEKFEEATTRRGEQSTLYQSAEVRALLMVRAEEAAMAVSTTVTFTGGAKRRVPVKPHYDD